MALPESGSISLNQINTELGKPSGSPISLGSASTGGYGALSSYSPSKPDGAAPHRISEFYNYNHSATPPSITITSYNSGYIYFTVSGTGYSPSVLRLNRSTTSASGPWTTDTAGPTSPRSVPVPTVTTWYFIEDVNTPSIFSNVYQYVSAVDTTPPSVPTGLYCDLGNGANPQRSIYIAWNASTDNKGVSGYELQRKTGTSGTWTTRYTGTNTFYDDDGSYNTQYYFQVRAYDAAGNYSAFSASAGFKTGPISCFVEGTLITLADGSQKAIETLTVNELLLSSEIETLQDTNDVYELYKWSSDNLSEKRISSPITSIKPEIAYKTIIINYGLLEATPEHSQLIEREGIWKFIPLKDVIVGDNLYGIKNEIIAVDSISVNLEERKIYPMSLSPSHTYFANGVLTHNIKPQDPV
ncbi:hypothetical protein HYN56_11020 [Flavobacterium crocinum]|uniref:Fibronectin type-III domain-containing protein n=1 Tax=Flavobacterium crocinum TaxID=2183896 RepID=A0A2S1YKY4_9FLAO|nr:hypothetical protein [Flavobacterium crocinum]AWK04725.1 hypothetical protein HYN56_11020 [Flavobacterium crocinum]